MIQTTKEYQNDYFKQEGYVIFENIEKAGLTFCDLYPHIITTSDAIDCILNDTNCDWIVLNDGSVAVLPQVFDKHQMQKAREEQ